MDYFNDENECPVCREYSNGGAVCDDCLENAGECPICGQLEINGDVCDDCIAEEDDLQDSYDLAHERAETSVYLASLL